MALELETTTTVAGKGKAATQADVARHFKVQRSTVHTWMQKEGFPCTKPPFDLERIEKWREAQQLEAELLGGDESPGLERYRLAKAALAELELEERKGSLLSREKVRTALIRWASVLRRMGERIAKRFGNEASGAVNDALGECQAVIDYEFGGSESSDNGAQERAFVGLVTVESADSSDDEPVG